MKFVIFGSHPALSLAETYAVLGQTQIFSLLCPALALLNTDQEIKKYQEQLGGIIKTGTVLWHLTRWDKNKIAMLIQNSIKDVKGKEKISFGLSVYDAGAPDLAKQLIKEINRLGLTIKKELKTTGRPVRFVTSKEPTLSSVIIKTNKLLESGSEFVMMTTPEGVYIGQTETIQDWQDWSERDFGRPLRNAKSGMLPPKVARMMINLARQEAPISTLLDPFCGSGTILMEAGMLGFKKIIGSDISPQAITESTENFAWLKTHQPEKFGSETKLLISPAQDLDKKITDKIDAIVTEVYLGPPLKGGENESELQKNLAELMTIYGQAFATLSKMMNPAAMAVVAFPAFAYKGRTVSLPLKPMLEKIGLKIEEILPSSLKLPFVTISRSGGIIYSRPGQRVMREILVFKKST